MSDFIGYKIKDAGYSKLENL